MGNDSWSLRSCQKKATKKICSLSLCLPFLPHFGKPPKTTCTDYFFDKLPSTESPSCKLCLLACFFSLRHFAGDHFTFFYAIVPKNDPRRCCNIAPSYISSQAWQGAEKHQFSYRRPHRFEQRSKAWLVISI